MTMNASDSTLLNPALGEVADPRTAGAPTIQVLGLPNLSAQPASAGEALSIAKHPLHSIETEVYVSLGSINMTVSQLLSLREGEVLSINHLLDAPVDVMVKGNVVARGVLVAVDDCFGVQITEIPTPLSLAN